MSWNLSCPDWVERLKAGRSLVPDLPLDLVHGERAVQVFNKLRLADVPGTPTMEDAGGDWFRDIVRAMFGSLDPITKARRIRELFLLVPKKNSKTTNGALMMLTALLLNERPRAPMGMSAPVQDVAEIAFNAIAGAIALDPVLDKKLHVREHLKTIVHRETKATLEVMTFDPSALTGPKWASFLVDEVHVVSKMAKAASALRQIRGGMIPYPEAFLALITTQSEEPPTGIMESELRKARAIREGKLQGAMLPVLYEFPQEMQEQEEVWRNPKNWHLVTPNAGRSITIPRLVEELAAAEDAGEAEVRAWASQHLNVQIGIALHSDRWAGALFWEPQADPTLTVESLIDRCEVICIGIDGGGLDDMLALSVLGRETETGDWLEWGKAWIHPVAVERRKKNASTYASFAADGDLVIVDEMGQDIEELVEVVKKVNASGLLHQIGVDRKGIEAIVTAIVEAGVDPEIILGIPQGWELVGTIKTTERRLAQGTMRHQGSRLMAWSVANCKPEPIGNAIKITKQVSGSAKIDRPMAMFNAVTLMSKNPESKKAQYSIAFV